MHRTQGSCEYIQLEPWARDGWLANAHCGRISTRDSRVTRGEPDLVRTLTNLFGFQNRLRAQNNRCAHLVDEPPCHVKSANLDRFDSATNQICAGTHKEWPVCSFLLTANTLNLFDCLRWRAQPGVHNPACTTWRAQPYQAKVCSAIGLYGAALRGGRQRRSRSPVRMLK